VPAWPIEKKKVLLRTHHLDVLIILLHFHFIYETSIFLLCTAGAMLNTSTPQPCCQPRHKVFFVSPPLARVTPTHHPPHTPPMGVWTDETAVSGPSIFVIAYYHYHITDNWIVSAAGFAIHPSKRTNTPISIDPLVDQRA
jgi:hypothetical protein